MRYNRNRIMKAIQSHSTAILYVLIGILLVYIVYPYVGNLGNQREGLANKDDKKQKTFKPIDFVDNKLMEQQEKYINDMGNNYGFIKYADQYQTFVENNKKYMDFIIFMDLLNFTDKNGIIDLNKPDAIKKIKKTQTLMTYRDGLPSIIDTIKSFKSGDDSGGGDDGGDDGGGDDDGGDEGGGGWSIF